MCSEFSCQAPAPTLLQYEKANLWERREKKKKKKKKEGSLRQKQLEQRRPEEEDERFPATTKDCNWW